MQAHLCSPFFRFKPYSFNRRLLIYYCNKVQIVFQFFLQPFFFICIARLNIFINNLSDMHTAFKVRLKIFDYFLLRATKVFANFAQKTLDVGGGCTSMLRNFSLLFPMPFLYLFVHSAGFRFTKRVHLLLRGENLSFALIFHVLLRKFHDLI